MMLKRIFQSGSIFFLIVMLLMALPASVAQADLIATTTVVNCGAGTPLAIVGHPINCVVTVTPASGTDSPTGTVSWATDDSGTFSPAASCTLSGSGGPATCSVDYTPSAIGDGTHLITANYGGDTAFDISSGNQTVTVITDAAPVITESDPQAITTAEDTTSGVLTLHATDADPGDHLTWSILVQGANGNGILSPAPDGFSVSVTFSPKPNFNGADSFTVQVSDSHLTDTLVVNVTVTPVADTFYVDNTNVNALDTNPGTDPTHPLLTISRGADLARAGDTVEVVAGTYLETVWLNERSGTASDPITFHAGPTVVVSGDGTLDHGAAFYISETRYIVIDGFHIADTVYRGIVAITADHLTIQNNQITRAGQHAYMEHQQGIYFKTVTDSLITGNVTYDNSCIGIRLVWASNNNVISNNVSYGNYSAVAPEEISDGAGIEVDDSDDNLIIHNTVYGNEDSGINLYVGSLTTGSHGNMVVGNLVYGNGDHGIDNNTSSGNFIVGNTVHGNYTSGINLELGSTGATVANNIVMDNGLNPAEGRKPGNVYVDDSSLTGTNLNHNLYLTSGTTQVHWNGIGYATLAAFKLAVPGQEAGGLEANPLFVAPAPVATVPRVVNVGDYHLMAFSPAIDSANSDAPYEALLDLDGNARMDDPTVANTGTGTRLYDDRGAYEFKALILTTLTVQPVTDTYGNTVALSATLSPAVSGRTINFTLNSVAACTGQTNASGTATCNAALSVDFGTYATGVGASFISDGTYYGSSGTANLTVNARPLTVSATGVNKVYDGTVTATVTLSDDRVGGDTLTVNYTSATFANKNVGNGKAVSVSSISVTGVDAANYSLVNTTASTTANITARTLTVSATGVNKVYDRTVTATVTLSDDRVTNDQLTVNYGSASFANKNVGNGKPVSVTGITVSGTDVGNYTFNSTAATTANITARTLIVSATGVDKVYDGTTTATVTLSDDRVTNDQLTVDSTSASFVDKNVGTAKQVNVTGISISGTDAGNYALSATTASTSADITPRALTVTALGINKGCDGTTTATVTLSDDRVTDDQLTVTYASASFADAFPGVGKAVSVTGISVAGVDAGNYTFNATADTTADITGVVIFLPTISR